MAAENLLELRAVLLDIEGTLTPLSFAYEILFPYARKHGPQFIRELWDSESMRKSRVRFQQLNQSDQAEGAPRIDLAGQDFELRTTIDYYLWLMERDRKVTPLKLVQGLIWSEGYRSGELKSEIFDDVPRAFSRWRNQGVKIAIFSSGSVLAQRQILQNSNHGDLTGMIAAYFDTETGAKRDKQAYASIAMKLEMSPSSMLFVSDVVPELDAAREAGMQTALACRPGNAEPDKPHTHKPVSSFDDLA